MIKYNDIIIFLRAHHRRPDLTDVAEGLDTISEGGKDGGHKKRVRF